MPAQAGIQGAMAGNVQNLDSRFRGKDEKVGIDFEWTLSESLGYSRVVLNA